MEVLIGAIVSGAIGLILKWARDGARRDQQALESLRALVESKQQEEVGRRKAS
ncbi:MAG: hypothetical protein ABR529_14025 [Actinomycetota bacterium]